MELKKRKLQILMAKNQLSVKELSEKSGLSANAISSFLSGRRKPSIKSLGMLANGLSVDVEEIIEDEKEKEQTQ